MIVLVYLIVLLRELFVPTIFHIVHPYIGIHSVIHLLYNVMYNIHSLYCLCSMFPL